MGVEAIEVEGVYHYNCVCQNILRMQRWLHVAYLKHKFDKQTDPECSVAPALQNCQCAQCLLGCLQLPLTPSHRHYLLLQ